MNLEEQLDRLDPPVRQMLAEDLPAQLAALRNALEQDRLETARQVVHTVRGSASFCKLQQLREAAAALEQSLLDEQEDTEITTAFTESVQRVIHALEAITPGAKEQQQ